MEGEKSCCSKSEQKQESQTETKPESKGQVKTTCCAYEYCTCGDNCTCAQGKINCDPCSTFVAEKNKNA
jgi:hypothetical protein